MPNFWKTTLPVALLTTVAITTTATAQTLPNLTKDSTYDDTRDAGFLRGNAIVDGATAQFQTWKSGDMCFRIAKNQNTICYRKK